MRLGSNAVSCGECLTYPPSAYNLVELPTREVQSETVSCPLNRIYLRFSQSGFGGGVPVFFGPLQYESEEASPGSARPRGAFAVCLCAYALTAHAPCERPRSSLSSVTG
jgi:hypothetical protein